MNDQHGAAAAVDDTAAAAAQQSVTALAAVAVAADDETPGRPTPCNGRLVQEGDTVILEVNRERYSFVHIKRGGCGCAAPLVWRATARAATKIPRKTCHKCCAASQGCVVCPDHRKVRVGKKDCSVDIFIGAPYGAVYRLEDDGQTLCRCARQARPKSNKIFHASKFWEVRGQWRSDAIAHFGMRRVQGRGGGVERELRDAAQQRDAGGPGRGQPGAAARGHRGGFEASRA